MWDSNTKKFLNGVNKPSRGLDGAPAQVWQAVRMGGFYATDYYRDSSEVTEGQVLTYTARDYRILFAGGGSQPIAVAIGITSCGNFTDNSQWSSATCQQDGEVCHIKTSDGWELNVKIEPVPF
jgi:hypothetical protein